MAVKTRPGSQSLEKGLAVLDALGREGGSITAAALAQALASLVEHGFVTHERERYRLSYKLLDLGQRVLKGADLLEAARPVIQRLHTEFRETTHLAVPEGGRMVYLHKLEGAGPFCTQSRIGAGVPMHCTGLGKAVLAFLPAATVESIVATHGMPRKTPRTITTLAALERELARIRRRGYALDDVEHEEDVRCVGAPVFDHRGAPVAALSVSAPTSRMTPARAHAVGAVLRARARDVSRALGWAPDDH